MDQKFVRIKPEGWKEKLAMGAIVRRRLPRTRDTYSVE